MEKKNLYSKHNFFYAFNMCVRTLPNRIDLFEKTFKKTKWDGFALIDRTNECKFDDKFLVLRSSVSLKAFNWVSIILLALTTALKRVRFFYFFTSNRQKATYRYNPGGVLEKIRGYYTAYTHYPIRLWRIPFKNLMIRRYLYRYTSFK